MSVLYIFLINETEIIRNSTHFILCSLQYSKNFLKSSIPKNYEN